MISDRFAISADVVHQVVDGEAVLLHLGRGCYYSLDAVGSRVWALLSQGADRDAIVATMLEEYEVAEPVLRRDLDALLTRFADAGLVNTQP
jgi:Coenzyme PQQ synthesis protein D (PqqD)